MHVFGVVVMPLNRIIEIQRRTVTRDPLGSETDTWMLLGKVWADKLSTKPIQKFDRESNRLVNLSTAEFRILASFVEAPGGFGVEPSPHEPNELDRILDDNGVTWDIIGIRADRQYITLQVGHLA